MIFRLFLLFSVVPVVEVWLIIRIGRVIGPLPTVVLLLAISLAGAWLSRSQGLRIVTAMRDELAAGRLPAAPLLDGALVLTGGVLLLTPGFFTDFLGLFFLIPATRTLLKGWLRRRLERALFTGQIRIYRD